MCAAPARPHRVADSDDSAPGHRALIVVDVQPTFCEGGELPVAGGNAVASRVAGFVREHGGEYALVVTTQDWHVDPGPHFAADPDYIERWPPHGVAGTTNAALHPTLAATLDAVPHLVRIKKGEYQAAYSGFDGADDAGRSLAKVLSEAAITAVDICGIAESHCVKSTAIDAVGLGYQTVVLRDLTVPVTEELGEAARGAMAAAGVLFRRSDQRGT
jgi:nicotinamidase/pyrazinamidase